MTGPDLREFLGWFFVLLLAGIFALAAFSAWDERRRRPEAPPDEPLGPAPLTYEDALERIAELDREVEDAPGWGAGVAVRLEERRALQRALPHLPRRDEL